jgi:hypothetical protein
MSSARNFHIAFGLRTFTQTAGDGKVKLDMKTSHKHVYRLCIKYSLCVNNYIIGGDGNL